MSAILEPDCPKRCRLRKQCVRSFISNSLTVLACLELELTLVSRAAIYQVPPENPVPSRSHGCLELTSISRCDLQQRLRVKIALPEISTRHVLKTVRDSVPHASDMTGRSAQNVAHVRQDLQKTEMGALGRRLSEHTSDPAIPLKSLRTSRTSTPQRRRSQVVRVSWEA